MTNIAEPIAPTPDRAPATAANQHLPARSQSARGRHGVRVQAALVVGDVDDPLEAEADQIASSVVEALRGDAAGPPVAIATATTRIRRAPVRAGEIRSLRPSPPTSSPSTRISRNPDRPAGIGRNGGSLEPTLADRVHRASGGVGLPAGLRERLEPRLGADLSGVRIQRSSALAPALNARAFTYGSSIHFAPGEYDPSSSSGVRLIAHEVAHTIQQGAVPALGGAVAPTSQRAVRRVVQREYDTLGSMGKARVDVEADNTYARKIKELEKKMGPAISREPAAHEILDEILVMLRRMVEAWAKATGTPLDAALTSELSFKGSERYYGAFLKTAATINAVFADTASAPLRTKLHLVYNAARNNSLSKYLEVAALELEQVLATGAATPQTVNVSSTPLRAGDWSGAAKQVAAPGFAAASGLQPTLEADGGKRQKSIGAIAESRKWTMATGSKETVFAPDEFSPVMGFSPAVDDAGKSRIGGQNSGLSMDEQRTLKGRDVPDLTADELAQLATTESVKGRAATLADPTTRGTSTTKVEWEQGREYYSVVVNSAVDKAAAKVRARLEAGISGSTDLILHAAQNLGLSMEKQRKLRLALIGWMLSNRDHTFYEIMEASKSYGLPFVSSPAEPGREYEEPENFWPMDVAKIGLLLPEKRFPRYFLTPEYKNQLAAGLAGKGKDADDVRTYLHVLNVPKPVLARLDEHDLAQVSALSDVIGAKGAKMQLRNVANTDAAIAATRHNELRLRRLREHPAYKYLARTHPAHAEAILNGLLASNVAAEVVPTYRNPAVRIQADELIAAGVPEVHVSGLAERAVLDLNRFSATVRGTAFGAGDAARAGNEAALSTLWADPLFVGLRRTYGDVWGKRVLPALIAHHHGADVRLGTSELVVRDDERIVRIEKIAELECTSGRWFSWGPLDYLHRFAAASSIFHHALSAGHSPQGYGLYVSDKSKGSQGYGKDPGCGIAVVDLDNVPTIRKGSGEQRRRLAAMTWNGAAMAVESLYKPENYAEMLLIYQGEGGEFMWARLTTSRGVRVTTDLARLDAHDVRAAYDGVTGPAARANMKVQATSQGVDTAAWPVP
ncbi:MAG: DUF4157 domain-containing protein [Ilumatobacteraceae bacterium]